MFPKKKKQKKRKKHVSPLFPSVPSFLFHLRPLYASRQRAQRRRGKDVPHRQAAEAARAELGHQADGQNGITTWQAGGALKRMSCWWIFVQSNFVGWFS